jgi:uncharacterized membrane protein YozB (DUF420 family)
VEVTSLPTVNAALNATAALLLVVGYFFIRRGMVRQHRACMIAAFIVSTLFLASYLTYHAQAGSRRFTGTGTIRTVYLTILMTHTVLAALVPPLAIVTLARALRGHFDRHVPLARWTLPIWLYVSVTGVIVYLMLYRL